MSLTEKWYTQLPDEIRDTIFRVTLKLPNAGEVSHDWLPFVDADYDELEAQLEEVPSQYAYASMILGEAKMITGLRKRTLQRRKAKVRQQIIDDARKKDYKLRVSDIDDLIEGDAEVAKLDVLLMKAERDESKLIGLVAAMRLKADSLRSLAGFKRQEAQDS
jgi:hypothetical protein